MALFPDEFKNSDMHRIGFALLGVAVTSFLLSAVGIVHAGPCSMNMIGFFVLLAVWIGFPLGCILLIVATIRAYIRKRNSPAENNAVTPSF